VSTIVWAIAGALSTVSICLLAAQTGSAKDLALLGPSTLVRGLAAAVIAGMVSFRRAFLAGIAIGLLQAIIGFNFLNQPGLTDFLVMLAILVAVYFQGRQSGETQTFSFAPKRRPVPERLRGVLWVGLLDRVGLLFLLVFAIVLPLVVTEPSKHLIYTTILVFAICGMSLTVLTGWGGQLSLGQMAFAGIGAFLAAAFLRGMTLDLGWGSTELVSLRLEKFELGPAIIAATLVTAALAALIGIGALRVRGLFLAVSTFAFGLAATQYLYRRPLLNDRHTDSVPLRRVDLFGLTVREQRTWYYVVLAVLVVLVVIVARLRRTGVGRTTIAVRDNPDAAAAYTVGPTRVKLRAFALAGGVGALGGALLGAALQSVPFGRFFTVDDSLRLVNIVVIGGLGSLTGPILGSMWVIGLPAFFPDNDLVPLLSSSIGLLVLLLYFPGGLVQIAYSVRDAILGWAERRLGRAPPTERKPLPKLTAREPLVLAAGVPALEAVGLTVRFGGIEAVRAVDVRVEPDQIVGLIGTNGAGKSTLMNAIGGFVPSLGEVRLLGQRVSSMSPASRARRGLGRTFQSAVLFPELTVRETVQVALEARHRSGMIESALFLPRSIRVERRRRVESAELIDFLGLGRYADSYIADLSTGTRRIVELAALLALDARVLCLDEPTAGVAQRETEAFGPLLVEIRRELGAAMLVIEHDMPLIMSISDHVYCLELGAVIAEGGPEAVRADPLVVASYLGTDDRAIARSGASSAASAKPAENAVPGTR
jgi:ABC-type branched-subunit amino acid transport system ATPase component/ABC-type branched-subunit amino acid transport system permease subunit